ncbi:MAG: type II secretion system F family protein, partial [Parcubacteria group bacterium]|nr:type II secretion system F family protein [Parcubacteria group bacterium]
MFQGELEADSAKRARLSLLQQGYDVLLLDSGKEKYARVNLRGIGFVPLKEKMLFVKHLSLMIKSGMVLDESLESLYEQAQGRMHVVLSRIVEYVRKGNLLSDALQSFPYTFSEFFVNMVRVGEKSGTLEQVLVNLSVKLRKDHELRSKVRSALTYPALVLIALGGLGITLSVVILPKLLTFFKSLSVDIPLSTRIFISGAEFLQQYAYAVGMSLFASMVAFVILNKLRATRSVIHWLVFHLPIFHRFSKSSNLANFCRSMHLMLRAGVPIDEALDIMSRAERSALYQRRIVLALADVRKGINLSDALARFPRLFPGLVPKMIHVGELSGNLSETFEYLAEFYEDELDATSKDLSTIIEPV